MTDREIPAMPGAAAPRPHGGAIGGMAADAGRGVTPEIPQHAARKTTPDATRGATPDTTHRAAPGAAARAVRRALHIAVRAASVAAAGVSLWAALVWITGAPHFVLPGPDRVAAAAIANAALIAHHAQATFLQLGAGLALGVALGALTALELAAFPRLRSLARPMLVFAQAVPVFALAPVLTLWLGYGPASKIAATALVVYFPVASCFFDALMRLPPALEDLSRAAGASRMRELTWLRIPNAMPGLASGLRLAAVYAPFGAVVGEWVGASRGLGYLMLVSNGRAQTDLMFAALFALAAGSVALFFAVDRGARLLERRFGQG